MEEPSTVLAKVPTPEDVSASSQTTINQTLLPAPVASLISFATATSSLSLRVGGFLGHLAINVSRIGALSGVELGRAVLESVLFRAGQDVLDSSIGGIGQTTAEDILDRTLSTLHSSLTHTSFLISAGFRVGTSGLSLGLGLSQALCTAIDAVLGDTETSKAIAAIVVLVQREFKNPATGVERVSLGDILSGTVGFALLQRWCWQRTDNQLRETGAIEAVWDIVVVDKDDSSTEDDELYAEDNESHHHITEFRRVSPCNSNISVRSRGNSLKRIADYDAGKPEDDFRTQISQHMKLGTSVRVTSLSTIERRVTVTVDGEYEGQMEPPAGYTLIAMKSERAGASNVRQYVFQGIRKRVRSGSFEINDILCNTNGTSTRSNSPQAQVLEDEGVQEPTRNIMNERPIQSSDETAAPAPLEHTENCTAPIQANTRRPRSQLHHKSIPSAANETLQPETPLIDQESPSKTSRRAVWKRNLQRGTSYKHLMDFWTHGQTRRHSPTGSQSSQHAQKHEYWSTPSIHPPSPDLSRASSVPRRPLLRRSSGLRPSLDIEQRRGSRESFHTRSIHRRGGSSIYTLQTNESTDSLVLHASKATPSRICLAHSLSSTGRLAGQYPYAPFAQNAARFVRFASASYGSSFLRFTGAATDPETRALEPYSTHHAEHRSFSSYARLPSSTVLLSSFVDYEGGTNMQGKTNTGMPLIHYICLDHESKAVVLTCRGTLGFEDILTDLTCDYTDLWWRGKSYAVHMGMLNSARRLISMHGSRLIHTIKAALEEFEDYGLVLCGHSLGGGVAALLGILMSQPCESETSGDTAAFVTASPTSRVAAIHNATCRHPIDSLALTLPPSRPIHVYAFGPAATVCPALAEDTKGLITTFINNADMVPALSLGNLRDIQAVSHAFKTDDSNAKGEVRRRVWKGLRKSFTETSGIGAAEAFFSKEWTKEDAVPEEEDLWPLSALKSLRAGMLADKLVPPGECFVVERRAVLQRLAFTQDPDAGVNGANSTRRETRAFKPASHLKITHVKDVASRFAEIRFEASMFLDHLPGRYEKVLQALWLGVA